jgi:hypothetical protein
MAAIRVSWKICRARSAEIPNSSAAAVNVRPARTARDRLIARARLNVRSFCLGCAMIERTPPHRSLTVGQTTGLMLCPARMRRQKNLDDRETGVAKWRMFRRSFGFER